MKPFFYSTFSNGEVKEFKEVREVKAICFIANLQQKKAIGYNFLRPKGVTTALTTITSVYAKLQLLNIRGGYYKKHKSGGFTIDFYRKITNFAEF